MVWVTALEVYGFHLHDALKARWDEPWAPVRETWGTGPTARAGARAMMALAGGPAPPRDPSKPRPRPREDHPE